MINGEGRGPGKQYKCVYSGLEKHKKKVGIIVILIILIIKIGLNQDSDGLVMKGSRVETIEAAREEYIKLLEEGWGKNSIYNSYF